MTEEGNNEQAGEDPENELAEARAILARMNVELPERLAKIDAAINDLKSTIGRTTPEYAATLQEHIVILEQQKAKSTALRDQCLAYVAELEAAVSKKGGS